ncbi:hypothetical protein DesLBE_1233 [Desulfitobacterium sp. LBE]|uniref:hypothetical protein n=1 Tax=Desulfitobacterium sp. LBE TaxID=884086 RepID=UPI00119B0F80|nr:hypothetical protein [Desulfitobacterium sp. LBE]TWH56976.1 hypothetical protein DesLBE_1233 [Desulfitobacterium sp. LBE]
MRNFNKLTVAVILVMVLVFGYYFAGDYRVTPLAAAKAHSDVGENAEPLGDVDFGWSKVYILDTDKGPRTVISIKSSLLWRAPVAVHIEKSADPIETVGWMSYTDNRGQAAVLAVETTDPQIAFIEAGPKDDRVRKEITEGSPAIFSWHKAIQANNELNAIALSAEGNTLYEYRYPKNTNVFRSEEFKWYSVDGDQ